MSKNPHGVYTVQDVCITYDNVPQVWDVKVGLC